MAHRTSADGSVGNLYAEADPGVPTQGTLITADDLNSLQEEIANAVESAGLTLDPDDNTQLSQRLSRAEALVTTNGSGGITLDAGAFGFGTPTLAASDTIEIPFDPPLVTKPKIAGGVYALGAYFLSFDADFDFVQIQVRNATTNAAVDLSANATTFSLMAFGGH